MIRQVRRALEYSTHDAGVLYQLIPKLSAGVWVQGLRVFSVSARSLLRGLCVGQDIIVYTLALPYFAMPVSRLQEGC